MVTLLQAKDRMFTLKRPFSKTWKRLVWNAGFDDVNSNVEPALGRQVRRELDGVVPAEASRAL
jgi:hypothetical protein